MKENFFTLSRSPENKSSEYPRRTTHVGFQDLNFDFLPSGSVSFFFTSIPALTGRLKVMVEDSTQDEEAVLLKGKWIFFAAGLFRSLSAAKK